MQKKRAQHLMVLAATVAVMGFATPAHAGFQWKSAAEEKAATPEMAPVEDDVVTPMPGEEADAPVATVEDVATEPLPEETASDQAPGLADTGLDADVVTGYGENLPLIIALRQIVPAEYQFAFAEGVDLSTPVSWDGGKSWTVLLDEVMKSVSLRAEINEKMVSIGTATPQDDMMMAAEAPAEPMSLDGSDMAMQPMPTEPATDESMPEPMYAAPPAHNQQQPAMTAMSMGPSWSGERGDLLRDLLDDWSRQAGVELFWSSEYNYALEDSFQVSGTYEEAVRSILDEFKDANPRPYGRLHEGNAEVPPVLVIETQ